MGAGRYGLAHIYLGVQAGMETPWDEKVAQYLAGRSRATIEQVSLGIGLKYASSHDHGEIARAMENAGWHSPEPCYGYVDIWEAVRTQTVHRQKWGFLESPKHLSGRFPPPWSIEEYWRRVLNPRLFLGLWRQENL